MRPVDKLLLAEKIVQTPHTSVVFLFIVGDGNVFPSWGSALTGVVSKYAFDVVLLYRI